MAADYLNKIISVRVHAYDRQENYLRDILTALLTSQRPGIRDRTHVLIEFTANLLNYKHISFAAQMIHLQLFPSDPLTCWYAAFLQLNLAKPQYSVEECLKIHESLNY